LMESVDNGGTVEKFISKWAIALISRGQFVNG